jgi:hypothetical protein
MGMLRRIGLFVVVIMVALGTLFATAAVFAGPPGPGSKQCSPGQNNIGGGPGNSGPGDHAGAPLKPPPSCPGGGH